MELKFRDVVLPLLPMHISGYASSTNGGSSTVGRRLTNLGCGMECVTCSLVYLLQVSGLRVGKPHRTDPRTLQLCCTLIVVTSVHDGIDRFRSSEHS